MRDGKRGGLLRKREWKFPDENDSRVYEDRERAVLKFTGQIAAHPGIRTEQRQMTFAPTARDIGEHRQDRQLMIVVPKQQRIVPKQDQAEEDDDQAGEDRAENVRSRGARYEHLREQTPNPPSLGCGAASAQRRIPNKQKCRPSEFDLRRSMFSVRRFLLHTSTGLPSVITSTFSSMPCARAALSSRAGGSSSGSKPRRKVP